MNSLGKSLSTSNKRTCRHSTSFRKMTTTLCELIQHDLTFGKIFSRRFFFVIIWLIFLERLIKLKFYPKVLAMILLLVFLPPIGLIFMYKFSPFKLRENILIAAACIGFFTYANYDFFFTDQYKKMPYELTAEEFRERFNFKSEELARQLIMKIPEPLEVSDGSFKYEFTPHLILSGKISGENISEIEIFAAPENQDESFQSIVCIGLIISIFNPELDQDGRSEVFNDLKMYVDKATANMNESTERGNVKYSVRTDENKKVWFKAEIKKNL